MQRRLVGILIGVVFVAVVVFAAMRELRVHCEVCMVYGDGEICEEAKAADREHAISQARNAACARLSSGVTDGIECNNTRPRSTVCSE